MANWQDAFQNHLTSILGPDRESVLQQFDWVTEIHLKAKDLLEVKTLASMAAPEVYGHLKELSVPRCPIRLTNLGRVNDAERVRESMIKLLTTPGNLREKYKAAKFPQAGIVTLTEILCVAKPHRFVLRNTAFTRALAKVTPFYSKKALDELPYEEFLDICREMTKIQKVLLAPIGLSDWAEEHRYLLLYAILTD